MMTVLSPESPAVAAGIGLFETMLAVNGSIVQLEDHYIRMAESCLTLGFPPLDESTFREAAINAVQSGEHDCALRIVRVCSATDEWLLHASTVPIPAATLSRRKRGRAVTLDSSIARSLPTHKMTSYAVCTIALRDAVAGGADEALFTDRHSMVLEGSATNVFAMKGTRLITAPVAAGILPGIVRAWVIATAASIGLAVEERAPSQSEIAAGSFFTGSLTTLAPVRELNGRPCVPLNAAFAELTRLYQKLMR